jgi:hypothetical protein
MDDFIDPVIAALLGCACAVIAVLALSIYLGIHW